jgi:ATP-dependent RNA helicase UAP56/SUB2
MSHENDELADYEAEAGAEQQEAAVKAKNKAGHAAVSTTGFSDFLLRPELRQAITDCGFEHPSEGMRLAVSRLLHAGSAS